MAVFEHYSHSGRGGGQCCKSAVKGSELLAGGAIGMEASIVAVVVCTAAGVAMLVMAVKRGNVVKPFWVPKGDSARATVAVS